jgi:hypothetical protein
MASEQPGSFVDTAADVLAVVILIVVPIAGIALFWLVHILPEKIAEQRHHPQKDAIKTLCLLSLVFGGLLWPFAWLWAYSKPVFHKLAYGRDKHDDFYVEAEQGAASPGALRTGLSELRLEVEALGERSDLAESLLPLKRRLEQVERAAADADSEAPR